MENCMPSRNPFKSTLTNTLNWKEESSAPLRQAVGALLYLSNGTRPDISFLVSSLAQHVHKPTEEAWECIKQLLRYLKETSEYGLEFQRNIDLQTRKISAYSDSDWGGDKETRRSTSGGVVFHNGNLVHWFSKRQECVTLSSCESEIVALSQTAEHTLWIRNLIKSLDKSASSVVPIILGDNQSSMKVAKDPRYTGRMKHIDIRDLFVKEKLTNGELEVEYCSSKENLADILTKPLFDINHFEKLRELLGVKRLIPIQSALTKRKENNDNGDKRKLRKVHFE
jgi:hypothetical protein